MKTGKEIVEVYENIQETTRKLPKEVGIIALGAVGAAIGSRFPNAVLFAGMLYLAGKLLAGGDVHENKRKV
jgi:uncharacterized membrane protein AbrB (regulator of aidB expression)